MTEFEWDITDASDELTPAQDGGTVDIADIPPVQGDGWQISPPDQNLTYKPVYGGVVGTQAAAGQVNRASTGGALRSLNSSNKFTQTVILIVLGVLSVSFLAVVISGVVNGTLDFENYTSFILALLAAFGFGGMVGRKTAGAGDGDG